MGVLLVSDDLHSLIAQLAAREEIIVIHDPLPEAVDFIEDGTRKIVLKADLAGRDRTDRWVDVDFTRDERIDVSLRTLEDLLVQLVQALRIVMPENDLNALQESLFTASRRGRK